MLWSKEEILNGGGVIEGEPLYNSFIFGNNIEITEHQLNRPTPPGYSERQTGGD